MKNNYTITSAKAQVIRCGLRFEGKKILGRQPGIKGWGAIDFLKTKGYSFRSDPIRVPKKPKTFGEAVEMVTEAFKNITKAWGKISNF
jgi:hypothetical protein